MLYIPDLPDQPAGEADTEVTESGDPDAAVLLGRCSDLRRYARAAGVELTDTPASLAELDECLGRWRADGQPRPWLAIEVGLYLGTVLVHHHEGAKWESDDTGRPLIGLATGYAVDVVDLGHDCVDGRMTLVDAYADCVE